MQTNAARARHSFSTQGRRRCIVVEGGSSPLAAQHADGFDETIAIAQMPGELPAVFAQRAMARIAMAERLGRHFESVTVLLGRQHDAPSRAARRLVVLGLSAHARASGQLSELLLQAPANASPDERSELLELAGTVTEASDEVSVRLSFGEARRDPPSGVFAKPSNASR